MILLYFQHLSEFFFNLSQFLV